MKAISSTHAPAAIGPYSQAIEYNGVLYLSGMLPIHPATNELVGTTLEQQTEQVLTNIQALLQDQGLDISSVLKTIIYLTSMDDFQTMNEVYARFFSNHRPARSCVAVQAIPKGAIIEIAAIVARE